MDYAGYVERATGEPHNPHITANYFSNVRYTTRRRYLAGFLRYSRHDSFGIRHAGTSHCDATSEIGGLGFAFCVTLCPRGFLGIVGGHPTSDAG